MPRISDAMLSNVVYLFPSSDDAEQHLEGGAAGFLIHKEIDGTGGISATYVVSNKHVALMGCPVVRLNRLDRTNPEPMPLTKDDWVPHDLADLAVAPLGYDHTRHEALSTETNVFVTPEMIEKHDIGIGDDVYMVGRFISMQGQDKNRPTVRFGHIAHMLDLGRIRYEHQHPAIVLEEECIAVEMRSRVGFSGSPVYVYGSIATTYARRKIEKPEYNSFFGLLGVNTATLPNEKGENSFVNAVIPAWKILEVMETPKLLENFEEVSKHVRNEIKRGNIPLEKS